MGGEREEKGRTVWAQAWFVTSVPSRTIGRWGRRTGKIDMIWMEGGGEDEG